MQDDKSPIQDPGNRLPGFSLNRREFLKISGSGIFVWFTLGPSALLAQNRPPSPPQPELPSDFNAFLRIGEDGRVSCFTGKIEMGQGVVTSLAQMLADELDVSVDAVILVMGDTDLCPWDMGTFGSRTTRFFGPPLRQAGAEARSVLLELASEKLKTPVEKLAVENGIIWDTRNKGNRISYAELVQGKRIERRVTWPVSVKKPSEFKIMGKSITRRDSLDKVTGKTQYAGDIRIPGMLYAKILRPPAHGAKLSQVDISEAKRVEGVQIIQEGDLIAALHPYPDVAAAALAKVKATYDRPESGLNENNIFDHLLKVAPSGEPIGGRGDMKTGEQQATGIIDETYLDGYVAHAPMEPHAAVVAIDGDRATVWPSSQTPFTAKKEVAEALGIPADRVRIISPFVGGGFGGKSRNLQVVEAARLAKLSGKPVQVAWSREEEFFHDSFRPAAVVKIRSGLDEQGNIRFWDYHVYFAGQRGADQFYNIPHHSTLAHGLSWVGSPGSHPFATGAWRAPGNNTNTFARESHIDIMAAKARMDPVAFRLRHLEDGKMRRLLEAAAEKFGWQTAIAPSGRGCGVACGIDAGTYVVTMAEVVVDQKTGNVQVKRVLCAQDMGLAINPEGATIQMEGCITMGLGYALSETIRFKGGEILDKNFDAYHIPRFSWLPRIETLILDNRESPPQGGGEPGIVTMGGVLANAIHDAVGVRMRRMPMTPERIKEVMRSV
jgi:nicotinate dehydrogenase subunit B